MKLALVFNVYVVSIPMQRQCNDEWGFDWGFHNRDLEFYMGKFKSRSALYHNKTTSDNFMKSDQLKQDCNNFIGGMDRYKRNQY